MPTVTDAQISPNPLKILIIIEGGCVQAVQSNNSNAQIIIIDYDTDSSDEDARQIAPKKQTQTHPTYVEPITIKV